MNQNKLIMKTQFISTKQHVLKTFGLFGLFMILSTIVNPILAQSTERIVTGVVQSSDGPLIGAAIILKGTSTGVSSNEKGEFTFPKELKENDVLVISYLGYETNEFTITSDSAYIEPFLEDIPIVIVATLRTKSSLVLSSKKKN